MPDVRFRTAVNSFPETRQSLQQIERLLNSIGSGGIGGYGYFIAQFDTPASYSGSENKFLRVNAGATAVDFFDLLNTSNTWTATQTFNSELWITNTNTRATRSAEGMLQLHGKNAVYISGGTGGTNILSISTSGGGHANVYLWANKDWQFTVDPATNPGDMIINRQAPIAGNADLIRLGYRSIEFYNPTTSVTLDYSVAGKLSFNGQIASTVATGTSPFDVASTTLCSNLNADLLDGSHASAFATSGHSHALSVLSDVSLVSAADKDFLEFNGSRWTDFDLFGGTNTWTGGQSFSAQITSTYAVGAPFSIASTTVCANLNADLLDGSHASAFAAAAHAHALSSLSDVTITAAAANDFLKYSGTAWVDFDLFGTSNTWTSTQTFNNEIWITDSGTTISRLGAGVFALQGSSRVDIVRGFTTVASFGNNTLTLTDPTSTDHVIDFATTNQILIKPQNTTVLTLTNAGLTVNVGTLTISIATGTRPLSVSSTTMCDNLNADLLDGNHASAFAVSGHTHALSGLSDVTITSAAANDFLKYSGSAWVDFDLFGTANTWTGGQSFSAKITSTLATGTPPFDVTSTTLCGNLNADMLDGNHSGAFAAASHTHDHGADLTGLSDDDHTQYALLAGRAGGQTLYGGTAAGNDLIFEGTSHATKGSVFLGGSGTPATVEVDAANFVFRITPVVELGDAGVAAASIGRFQRVDAAGTASLSFHDGTSARKVVLDTATQTLTNKTLTTPTIGDFTNAQHGHTNAAGGGTLSASAIASGTLAVARGGTGISSATTGDIIYASAADTWAKLAVGTNGHVLTLAAGIPSWAAPSGGATNLDGLTDVTITSADTNHLLQYSGGAWINRANLQLGGTTGIDTFDFSVVADTADYLLIKHASDEQLRLSARTLTFVGPGANNADFKWTVDAQLLWRISGTDVIKLTTTGLLFDSAQKAFFRGTTQYINSSASAVLELASTDTAGIIRYNAKASHDLQIDSSTEATVTANKLALNAGTYHVGFGWSVDGQLDTIIDNADVDSFVAIKTTYANNGGVGNGVKQIFRGNDSDAIEEADVGYEYWYYAGGTVYFDSKLETVGAGSGQYKFSIGTSVPLRMDTSQFEIFDKHQFNTSATWMTLNANDVSTQLSISAKSASEVQIASAGTSNPSILIRPRGNAECIFSSNATTSLNINCSTAVTSWAITPTSGNCTLNLFTSGGTHTINIGKSSTTFNIGSSAAGTVNLGHASGATTILGSGASSIDFTTSTSTIQCSKFKGPEWEYTDNMTIDLASASNKTLTCENSSTGKMTVRVTPDISAPASDDQYAKVGGVLKADTTTYNSTATVSEETLASYTVKANSFVTSGCEIRFRFRIGFANTARTKAVRVMIGSGSVSGDILGVSTLSGGGIIEGYVRKVAGGMTGYAWAIPDGATYATSLKCVTFTSGDSGTSDWVFYVRSQVGTGAAAGDVNLDHLEIDWYPGPSA